MELTPELLIGLGFIETEKSWVDDYCRVYKDQLPATLKEFKNMLTGKSFNKGLRKGQQACEEGISHDREIEQILSNPGSY